MPEIPFFRNEKGLLLSPWSGKHVAMKIHYHLIFFIALVMQGCGLSPASSDGGVKFVSSSRELALGKENYQPLIQAQGGAYTADPSLNRYVQEVGHSLARSGDRVELPYEFTVLNDSVPNAWSLPGGKIGINRGLLVELDSEGELAAVLGHEIAHATARHVVKRMEKQFVFGALLQVFSAVGVGGVAIGSAALGVDLVSAKFSRNDETEADRLGMRYMSRAGYDPEGAVELQKMFVRLNEEKGSNWADGLFASHPPSPKRVEANKKFLLELPRSGKVGRQEYSTALAALKKDQEAYRLIDAGEKLLEKKQASEALASAKKAALIAPREPKAFSLMGRAEYHLGRNDQAIQSLSHALQLHNGYFFDHYSRAVVHYDMGNYAEAHTDAQNSVALFETSDTKSLLAKVSRKLNPERRATRR